MVCLVILFSPKLYIILLHPEKNVRSGLASAAKYKKAAGANGVGAHGKGGRVGWMPSVGEVRPPVDQVEGGGGREQGCRRAGLRHRAASTQTGDTVAREAAAREAVVREAMARETAAGPVVVREAKAGQTMARNSMSGQTMVRDAKVGQAMMGKALVREVTMSMEQNIEEVHL